jgi:hypothetical protein
VEIFLLTPKNKIKINLHLELQTFEAYLILVQRTPKLIKKLHENTSDKRENGVPATCL